MVMPCFCDVDGMLPWKAKNSLEKQRRLNSWAFWLLGLLNNSGGLTSSKRLARTTDREKKEGAKVLFSARGCHKLNTITTAQHASTMEAA